MNNFGINGQDEYDNFICLSKKCKKRKKDKHKVRIERRRAKNDARKAENEQLRAETFAMKSMVSPKRPVSNVIPNNYARQPMPVQTSMQQPPAPPNNAGMGSSPVIIVFAVLLVGGAMVMMNKKQILPAS